jgi:RNA polymerase sigma factor FliA
VQDAQIEEDGSTTPATPEAADEKLGSRLSGIAMAMAAGFISPETEGIEQVPDFKASPEEQTARNELLRKIRAVIAERPDAERKLLERHYFDGVTFDEAATEIGLSKSWASRLHARALEAVARDLKRANIEG